MQTDSQVCVNCIFTEVIDISGLGLSKKTLHINIVPYLDILDKKFLQCFHTSQKVSSATGGFTIVS